MNGDHSNYRVKSYWKERVVFWEGDRGYDFDAGWGVQPPVLFIPSPEMWDDVVPTWMQGRRDVIVDRLRQESGHTLFEDIHGHYRNSPERRELAGGLDERS